MNMIKTFVQFSNISEKKHLDLFEYYELQPRELRKIISVYEDDMVNGMTYNQCQDMLDAVQKIGYTFDYGLDGEPFGLRPINVELEDLEGYE